MAEAGLTAALLLDMWRIETEQTSGLNRASISQRLREAGSCKHTACARSPPALSEFIAKIDPPTRSSPRIWPQKRSE